jgi:phosphoglucomutase
VYDRAVAQARRIGADTVIATDPDTDRLGIAARAGDDYALLSGNQIGALLADYRLARLFGAGVLTPDNASHAAVVKTYVTSDLIKAVAEHYGVRCVETLTGFKYIGAKLRAYAARVDDGGDGMRSVGRAEALAAGTYLVLGCEESFGYLAGDYVRDKDANGAALMFAEVAADSASRGASVLDRLDELYLRHGYHAERLATLPFEGQRGAADRAALLDSYRRTPPRQIAGVSVDAVQDFGVDTVVDTDGERVPAELMLRFSLADGGRVTVRGSGTEPKLKYYIAMRAAVAEPEALSDAKAALAARLEAVWTELREDVATRLGA